MKFRVIVLLVLLTFTLSLAACSLAEDITPPPGYQSPTPPATLDQTVPTSEPVLSPGPTATLGTTTIASTPGLVPVGTEPITSAAGSPSVVPVLMFSGKVSNASGSPLAGNLTAQLYLYNSGSSTLDQTLTTDVQPTGLYQFVNVPADVKTTYFVMVDFDGVTYTSDPVTYDGTVTTHDLPITVYDKTNDLSSLSLTQIHMQFDFSIVDKIQAQMLYVISNTGLKSVAVKSDGTSIPFIQIPTGAAEVQFQLAQGATPLATSTDGFALLPGADRQYAIIASFTMPYTSNLKLVQPFSLPVASETVIVPEGVRVSSDQLNDAGKQAFQGVDYHLYQGGNLASDSTLALTISGKPGGTTGSVPTQKTSILIGVGAAGILLIGLGIFLYLRDRNRSALKVAEAGAAGGEELPGEDAGTLADAIIALDDQFKAGLISKEAYVKRREELKKRLRELV